MESVSTWGASGTDVGASHGASVTVATFENGDQFCESSTERMTK